MTPTTFTGKTVPAMWPSALRFAGAIWAPRSGNPSTRSPRMCSYRVAITSNGRENTIAKSEPKQRLAFIVPLTIFLIFIILYAMFRSFKWALLILANVAMAPVGGLLALLVTGTFFSVSSGVGFLALFGVSVQTGVIMLEYINQLRARGYTVADAAVEGAVLRLRPIMMTMLVATLGLLPAAMSHAIGSDSQRPFAIVIVGGLMAALALSIFLLPTLYVWIAQRRRQAAGTGSGGDPLNTDA